MLSHQVVNEVAHVSAGRKQGVLLQSCPVLELLKKLLQRSVKNGGLEVLRKHLSQILPPAPRKLSVPHRAS